VKAIICNVYGPPEVLRIEEVEEPLPGTNEVLVRIHATTVTVGDSRIRGFRVPWSFWLPARLALGLRRPKKAILGSVFAGEIKFVGEKATKFKEGDMVLGSTGHDFGAYAEYICVNEKSCFVPKPASLTYEEAASIPWGGLTALNFLRKANIQQGQSVLIYGASGAVGTSAVQLAGYFGAEVTGVCSTSNLELVKSLGADRVIDYTREDFTTMNKQYDVIFDTVGKASLSACVRCLMPGGTLLHAVATPAVSIRMKIFSLRSNKKLLGGTFTPTSEDLQFLYELVEAGKIKPVIDRIYPLEQIVEAHRYVDQGHKKGNVIIIVNHA
jgi:NADPH:quinone reductase-like Zn-dependent oxidoreductase